MSDTFNYDEHVRNDPRMIALLWEQHKERSEMSAKHAQRFVVLALTIKKEHERND